MTARASVARHLLACLAAAWGGCHHAQLMPAAAGVDVRDTPAPPSCRPMGQVAGRYVGTLLHGDRHEEGAVTDLRNHAHILGATAVWHTDTWSSAHAALVAGEAYFCPTAPAYPQAAPVPPQAAPPP